MMSIMQIIKTNYKSNIKNLNTFVMLVSMRSFNFPIYCLYHSLQFYISIDLFDPYYKKEEGKGNSNCWYYNDLIEKSIKTEKQKRVLKHVLIKLGVLVHYKRYFVCKDSTKFPVFDRHRGFCKRNIIIFFPWK
jgi:hypothetical protein